MSEWSDDPWRRPDVLACNAMRGGSNWNCLEFKELATFKGEATLDGIFWASASTFDGFGLVDILGIGIIVDNVGVASIERERYRALCRGGACKSRKLAGRAGCKCGWRYPDAVPRGGPS